MGVAIVGLLRFGVCGSSVHPPPIQRITEPPEPGRTSAASGSTDPELAHSGEPEQARPSLEVTVRIERSPSALAKVLAHELGHSFRVMHSGKDLSHRRLMLAAGLALAVTLEWIQDQGAGAQIPPAVDARPGPALSAPHMLRGDAVEDRYRAYEQRLERFHAALVARLTKHAVHLLAKLRTTPPAPVPPGYQVLPRLVADAPVPRQRPRATAARYSWPWTERLIERDVQELARLEAALDGVTALTPSEQRAVDAKMVSDYLHLRQRQRTIDAHIQYNRLWQAAIAKDQSGYNRQTALYDAVLERQAIIDALAATDDSAFQKALGGIPAVDSRQSRDALEAELRAREASLSRAIHAATDSITVPSFLSVENPSAHAWIVNVPLYTDIEDAEFVRSCRAAIEGAWRLRDGEDEFRVRLRIQHVSAERLYRQRRDCAGRGDCVPPRHGERIDVDEHVALFPNGGGVLTTGARSTHVLAGRAIVLGAHDIAPHVLAHEFGHVLGFRDVYFRSYRDLGRDGYEVMEVRADPEDIMGAPEVGPVLRRHFEELIESRPQP